MARQNRVTRRSRRERQGLLDSLREGAGDVVQSVVNEVAPGVVGALDVDEVVQRVDIQAVMDRIDVEELVERIDVNALLDKVDIDRLLERVDLQALVKRMDVDQLIDELDVNALLERIDVDALVARTEIGDIVARSGAGVAAKALDVVRSLGVGLDAFVHRWVDRLLRRRPASLPVLAADRDLGLQGHDAGAATRLGAFAIDVVTAATLFSAGGLVVEFILSALTGKVVRLSQAPPLVSTLALAGWWFIYCAYALSVAGRTAGMAALGLRVVRTDGSELNVAHAVLRVLVFPLSFVLFGIGFIPMLVRRDRRALHDLIGQARVVYAWDARAARLRFLARSRAT